MRNPSTSRYQLALRPTSSTRNSGKMATISTGARSSCRLPTDAAPSVSLPFSLSLPFSFSAQQRLGDHQLLDLARPLVDAQRPHLAVELLDDGARHQPLAAVQL